DIGKKSRCAPVEHRAGDDVYTVVDPDVPHAILVAVEVATSDGDEVIPGLEGQSRICRVVLEIAIQEACRLHGDHIDTARADSCRVVILEPVPCSIVELAIHEPGMNNACKTHEMSRTSGPTE